MIQRKTKRYPMNLIDVEGAGPGPAATVPQDGRAWSIDPRKLPNVIPVLGRNGKLPPADPEVARLSRNTGRAADSENVFPASRKTLPSFDDLLRPSLGIVARRAKSLIRRVEFSPDRFPKILP